MSSLQPLPLFPSCQSVWPCSKISSIFLQGKGFVPWHSKTYLRPALFHLCCHVTRPARVTRIHWGKIWNTAYSITASLACTIFWRPNATLRVVPGEMNHISTLLRVDLCRKYCKMSVSFHGQFGATQINYFLAHLKAPRPRLFS